MPFSVPVRTPALLKKLLRGLHFSLPIKEKVLYATFDDGPLPDLCPWILDCLREHEAKASFFLVGENAAANPALVKQILEGGHSIGNHTQHHLNGFDSLSKQYCDDVEQCRKILNPFLIPGQKLLFRPPYGRIRPKQIRLLRQSGYEIIMWDVLSKDYDSSQSAEMVYENVVRNVRPGSILVFHDNLKAEERLKQALPRILKTLTREGYRFDALNFQSGM